MEYIILFVVLLSLTMPFFMVWLIAYTSTRRNATIYSYISMVDPASQTFTDATNVDKVNWKREGF